MAKKVEVAEPIGPVLAENLYRLGYGDIVIRNAEIARLVAEKDWAEFFHGKGSPLFLMRSASGRKQSNC